MIHILLFPNKDRDYGTIINENLPNLDHTGTGIYSQITDRYYEFPLKKYVPTGYINFHQKSNLNISLSLKSQMR